MAFLTVVLPATLVISKTLMVTESAVAEAEDCTPSALQSSKFRDLELRNRFQTFLQNSRLSLEAKSIKVTCHCGTFWLRGLIKTQGERTVIIDKAKELAGPHNVHDDLQLLDGIGPMR